LVQRCPTKVRVVVGGDADADEVVVVDETRIAIGPLEHRPPMDVVQHVVLSRVAEPTT
jgi:hypothetical protein